MCSKHTNGTIYCKGAIWYKLAVFVLRTKNAWNRLCVTRFSPILSLQTLKRKKICFSSLHTLFSVRVRSLFIALESKEGHI